VRAVNLLPRELEQKRKAPPLPVLVACGASVLATGVLAAGYLSASSAVGQKNRELAAAQAELAATPPPAPPPASVSALPAERQARASVLATALAQRVPWDRVLREVSLVLPDDVWLTALDATTPPTDGTTPPSNDGFHLSGFTYSQASVARLLARLSVIPDLGNVALLTATGSDIADRHVVQFEIGGNVRFAGASS
jgi:Tfp pilus assembly protein PilN